MTDFVLYSPEDEQRIKDLYQAVVDARNATPIGIRRVGDGPDQSEAEAVKAYNDAREEINARTPTLELAPLTRREWRELGKAHPMREEPEDAKVDDLACGGFNEETFPDALLAHAGTVTKVRNAPRKKAADLIDALPQGKFLALYNVVYQLNTGDAIDPKALSVSAPTTPSDET